MIKYFFISLILCTLCITSCVSPELADSPETPPTAGNGISLQVDFTITNNIYSRSMSFSEEKAELKNVWIVVTNVVNGAATFSKQQLTAKGNLYSATLDREAIAGDNCRFYFIGNTDLIPDFSTINTLEKLRTARISESLEHSGVVQKRYVVATTEAITPSESNGKIVVNDVKLYYPVARIEVDYKNQLEKIQNITISGTSKYGTLQSLFDIQNPSAGTPGSFEVNDNAPGMGGSNGVVGLGYYYVNPNGNNPVAVQVTIAGEKRTVNFSSVKAGFSYSVVIRYGTLLGYSTKGAVSYSNGNFVLPSYEVLIDLVIEQGTVLSSDASWLELETVKSRAGGVVTETKRLRCHANISMQGRSGKITATINGSSSAVFTFTQSSDVSNVAGIEFVKIPRGSFVMGSPVSEPSRDDDETQHVVTLSKDFSMGKYEVTNSQFCLFLNAKKITADGLSADNKVILRNPGEQDLRYQAGVWSAVSGKEKYPVVNVTWLGASEFASWAGGALPTEAQWEYACRGDYTNKGSLRDTKPFGIGTGYELTQTSAQFFWNYSYRQADGEYVVSGVTAPTAAKAVGSYSSAANNYELKDMHGNVWEWCSDIYSPTYGSSNAANSVTDPTGAQVGTARVMRGGSWYYYARACRSAFRMSATEDTSSDNVGFRVVRQ